jgi:hypothetical protein
MIVRQRSVHGRGLQSRRRLGDARRRRFRSRVRHCFHQGFGYRGRRGVEVPLTRLRLRLHTICRGLRDGRRLRVFWQGVGHIMAVVAAQLDRHVFVNRAGVRLLFGDAEFGKQVEDFVSFDFQLARQLVDSNLSHNSNLRSYGYSPGVSLPGWLSPGASGLLETGEAAFSILPNCSNSSVSASGSKASSGLSES